MSLLTFLVSVSSVLFIIIAADLYKRKKLTFLHLLIFLGGGGLLVIFSLNNDYLNTFGQFFGIARGADLIVYISIIVLVYLFFALLNQNTKQQYQMTKLNTNLALQSFDPNTRKPTNQSTCFLIRAYNEAQTIGQVIDEIIQAGYHNICIVDDGSQDPTASIIHTQQQLHSHANIIHLQHPINRGGGAANKTLRQFAKQYHESLQLQRFVTYDADGQMDINDMQKFEKKAQTNAYDVILGSRFADNGSARNITTSRKIILRGSKFVNYLFSGIWITDPPNGYKMFNIHAINHITIQSDGMAYASEIHHSIQKNKLRYTEIGVTINYSDYSLLKGQKNSNAIRILAELIYKALFFK